MFWSAKSSVLVIMKIEQVGMAAFWQQAESGGVDEFVVQRFGGVYHLFAVNRRAGVSYFLQERRGDYKTWLSLDRAAAFLSGIGVSRFTVRFEDNKHAEKDDRGH